MAYIYAYPPQAEDCASIGLVGALLDRDAVFDLRAGEFGELTFEHPIDPWGKWRALVNGAVLKTRVPVRLCPELQADGSYAAAVDIYTVSDTATQNQRYIYSLASGGWRKKLLNPGETVTVTGVADPADDGSRYRVRWGWCSSYMERGGLTMSRQSVPVSPDAAGLEAVSPSYAVRQQLFRVCGVQPSADDSGNEWVRVTARRIAYDLLGNLTTYSDDGMVSCRQACEGILSNTLQAHGFTIRTDIGDLHAGFDAAGKNPVEALLDPETGVAARWGAEVVSDDHEICVLRRAGLDRGVEIRYGRNLLGVSMDVDASGAANALRPVGEGTDGAPVLLDGRVVNGRCGYNYDARSRTCQDWLPEGYAFLTRPDGSVEGSVIVRADAAPAVPALLPLAVKDARVDRSSLDVTLALARRRMAAEAVARFEAGCDAPELSLEVSFIKLGDTAEYAQYRHLEPLFIYDRVHVRHARLGISADVDLTRIKWLVRAERVSEAGFGALTDMSARISGWQISGLEGGKLSPGSVRAGQLGDGCVDARHLQAESVNAQALQAGCVTTDKLVAGAVTADKVVAGAIRAGHIAAEAVGTHQLAADCVTAGKLAADAVTARALQAGCVTADKIAAGSITAAQLVAGLITAQSGLIAVAAIGTAQIADGSVTAAKIVSLNADVINAGTLSVERLLIVGEDGLIYRINATSAGLTPQQLQQNEYRQHLNGTVIVAHSVTAAQIAAQTITGNEIAANTVTADKINVSSLFASQAFIGALTTNQIIGNKSLTIIAGQAQSAGDTADAVRAELGAAQTRLDEVAGETRSVQDTLQRWFEFTDTGLVTSQPAYIDAGGAVHGRSVWSTLVDNTGFHIRRADLAEYVGSFHRDRLRVKNLEVGGIVVKASSRGGMVWVKGG